MNIEGLKDPVKRRKIEEAIRQLPEGQAREAAKRLMLELLEHGEFVSKEFLTPTMPLREYVREAWHVLEPNRFVASWHIDAMAEHLEAATKGQIRNLLINIPPRSSKSVTVSQLWPTWVWTFRPTYKWLFASYSNGLSTEHAWRARILIESEWYRNAWGHVFHILDEQNQKVRYDNNQKGYRMSTSVASMATGFGGDSIVVDDPNDINKVASENQRAGVNGWWDTVMSTRLNDALTGIRVVIQQRCHEEDLTGHILEKEKDEWVHLKIPMRYAGEKNRTFVGGGAAPFWEDPREYKGELMAPERFPEAEVRKLERKLGQYGSAGQLNQEPAPPGGGLFKRDWFGILEAKPRHIVKTIRYWDLAATDAVENPGACWTTGLKMSKTADGLILIEDVKREQLSPAGVDRLMKQTAVMDGRDVRIVEEREGGASGKSAIASHAKLMAGYDYHDDPPSGDKVTRARPFAAQAEASNVYLLKGDWNEPYLDETSVFPNGKWKDQVDASSGAYNQIEAVEWSGFGGIFAILLALCLLHFTMVL